MSDDSETNLSLVEEQEEEQEQEQEQESAFHDEQAQLLPIVVLKSTHSKHRKLPYPKQVFFIVGNEFCERFSYYGMKAVLAIYLKSKLHFSEDTSTVIYHTFSGLCYFTPLFGAMLADQVLGKFRTIFWISIIYVLGHLLKTLAAIPTLGLPPTSFSLIGLLLIAIGTGGIKPCVSAFGGDQFKMPEQERQLQTFFSIFYFAINAGSLISTFITPIFRQDIQCFGDDTCYSLAFGVPALLMLIATVILVMGKSMYVHKPAQGSILTKVFGSIGTALARCCTSREKKDHWLDHAKGKYDSKLIEDTKILLRVLLLYLPLPVFWALFDQQGSRWTFQATRMNGQVGSYIIKPDQMQLVNPAFILILIPMFDQVIYPIFAKINFLVKPLQRITTGGILTAAAFFISGFVELELAKTYDRVPYAGESHLHMMNFVDCPMDVRVSNGGGTYNNHFEVLAQQNSILYDLQEGLYDLEVRFKESCDQVENKMKKMTFQADDSTVSAVLARANANRKIDLLKVQEPDDPKKEDDATPRFKVIFNTGETTAQKLVLHTEGVSRENDEHFVVAQSESSYDGIAVTPYGKIDPGSYDVYYDDEKIGTISLPQGGVHTFVVNKNGDKLEFLDFLLTKENSMHMLWLIPQFFVITAGEIMFSITGLEFSYSQAPASMKSVLQAAWLLTVAFGNLIVIIVAELKAFDQATEFFLFGTLMIIDMALFALMAWRYKYVDLTNEENESMAMKERAQEARVAVAQASNE